MKTPIGKLDPTIRTAHIWGGGIAGLLMASFLSRQGFKIHLYEKSSRLGGKVGTDSLPTGLVEWGPNAIYATDQILDWLHDLGLKPIRARRRLKRWVWRGKLYSPKPLALLGRIAPKLRLKSPVITSSTTVADFFRPLISEKYLQRLLSPALQGIYGTTADKLTVLSLWPQLELDSTPPYWKVIKYLRGPKARSVSFAGGMQAFVDALEESINGEVHLNHQGAFELKPNTIICTDAHVAAELLSQEWNEGSAYLKSIPYLPISSVTFHSIAPLTWSERGFGVLFPRDYKINSLGCLFNHSIFPGRIAGNTKSSMTFILPDSVSPEDKVEDDLQKLQWAHENLSVKSFSYDRGLPLYNEARWSAIKKLNQSDSIPQGLVLFGNYVAGISLRDMIHAASSFAHKLGVE